MQLNERWRLTHQYLCSPGQGAKDRNRDANGRRQTLFRRRGPVDLQREIQSRRREDILAATKALKPRVCDDAARHRDVVETPCPVWLLERPLPKERPASLLWLAQKRRHSCDCRMSPSWHLDMATSIHHTNNQTMRSRSGLWPSPCRV